MNACIQTFSLIKGEAYRVKYYVEKRFRDITNVIKKYPVCTTLACGSFLAGVKRIYRIVLPVFSSLLLLDYLNNTYLYESSPQSSDFFSLFALDPFHRSLLKMKISEFSPEEREELAKEVPELLEYLDKTEQDLSRQREEMSRQEEARKNDSRPVLLVLQAKSDHNGALQLASKDSVITIHNGGMDKLKEKYKIEVIENIANIDDVRKGLENIANTIQQVWMFAHGSPTSMTFSDDYAITKESIGAFAGLLRSKIAQDADVILYSCGTAKKIARGNNIATELSGCLPDATVWAQKKPTAFMAMDLEKDVSIKINFWKPKSRLVYLKEKIWNICCLRPFEKIEIKIDVTAKIKGGKECS